MFNNFQKMFNKQKKFLLSDMRTFMFNKFICVMFNKNTLINFNKNREVSNNLFLIKIVKFFRVSL